MATCAKIAGKKGNRNEQAAGVDRRLRAEIERLKNALDIATAGKYSALMLELAAGRAQQIHDALQVSILKAENEELRNAQGKADHILTQIIEIVEAP